MMLVGTFFFSAYRGKLYLRGKEKITKAYIEPRDVSWYLKDDCEIKENSEFYILCAKSTLDCNNPISGSHFLFIKRKPLNYENNLDL